MLKSALAEVARPQVPHTPSPTLSLGSKAPLLPLGPCSKVSFPPLVPGSVLLHVPGARRKQPCMHVTLLGFQARGWEQSHVPGRSGDMPAKAATGL